MTSNEVAATPSMSEYVRIAPKVFVLAMTPNMSEVAATNVRSSQIAYECLRPTRIHYNAPRTDGEMIP